jgi:hypothetical protein
VCSCKPRIRTTGDGAIMLFPIRIEAPRSKLFLWVKCVRTYLSRANCIPCVEAQARHWLCADSSAMQCAAVDSLYVSRLMWSAKPNKADICRSMRLCGAAAAPCWAAAAYEDPDSPVAFGPTGLASIFAVSFCTASYKVRIASVVVCLPYQLDYIPRGYKPVAPHFQFWTWGSNPI